MPTLTFVKGVQRHRTEGSHFITLTVTDLLLVCKSKYFIRVLQRQFPQQFDTVFGWSVELTDLPRHYNCTTYRGGKGFTHILYVNSKQEFSHIFPWGGVWDTLSTFSMCVCVCVSHKSVCVWVLLIPTFVRSSCSYLFTEPALWRRLIRVICFPMLVSSPALNWLRKIHSPLTAAPCVPDLSK